jgi:acetyltransferase-like isoleucine patch superfamily enzyme
MSELHETRLASTLFKAYRCQALRKTCLSIVRRLEGGEFYSSTLRRILEHYHGVRVGEYSYGECMIPGIFPAGVTVGRYVSVASGVRVFLRNHPMDRLSMHPFFYNSRLGVLTEDTISSGSLQIGHDAWLGERAIITAGCSCIGIGAVVGAGAVVTNDVPDFAVVAGSPARILRYRFSGETCELVRASRWWECSAPVCIQLMDEMTKALGDKPWQHPLLSEAHKSVDGRLARRPGS